MIFQKANWSDNSKSRENVKSELADDDIIGVTMTPEVSLMKKTMVLGTIGLLLLLAFFTLVYYSMKKQTIEEEWYYKPTRSLPDSFVIFVDEPETEWEHMFASSLSSLSNSDNYNPLFILDNGALDEHQLWTIRNSIMNDLPKLLFSNDKKVANNVSAQVDSVILYPMNDKILGTFLGFDGYITVASYRESLWASPVCAHENKIMIIGEATFAIQEECFSRMTARGLKAKYVILTNPEDYLEGIYGEYLDPFNIKSLSLMASQLASYHGAFVLTDIVPSKEPIGDIYPDDNPEAAWNDWQTGALVKLREINTKIGPVKYVALVGSIAAVPHFFVAGFSGSGNVSSDNIYGFLDDDPYTMDAAVGRIINYNLPGASNQIARTLGYDMINSKIKVQQTIGGDREVTWRTHGSVWNGFEVADQRLQMSPGWYMKDDLEDEGFSWDYMRTTGNEGYRDLISGKEVDFQPVMESSGIVFYRGHGSHHASLYVYEPDEEYTKGRLEGYVENSDMGSEVADVDSAHHYFMPPQIGVFVSCLNTKAQGYSGEEPTDLQEFFSINYLYGGAIGLFGATEVSYSNLGQDLKQLPGRNMGNYHWDKNNAWYAFLADGLLNHEDEHGSMGEMLQWAENRYMNNPNKDYKVSPLIHQGDSVDWVEVTFFCLYGDPAFKMPQSRQGPNEVDPWHNGDNDV